MAFEKRTWLARIGTGLNKFIIGTKDGEGKQTLTNSPDSVTQQGDVISAENLNDLENRIEAGLGEKQDVLIFDNVPMQNSDNPVKSGGVYTELLNKANSIVTRSFSKTDSMSLTSQTMYEVSQNASLSGYTLLGVVSWNFKDGSLYHPDIAIKGIDINGTTVSVSFYSRTSTSQGQLYSYAFNFIALYIKN